MLLRQAALRQSWFAPVWRACPAYFNCLGWVFQLCGMALGEEVPGQSRRLASGSFRRIRVGPMSTLGARARHKQELVPASAATMVTPAAAVAQSRHRWLPFLARPHVAIDARARVRLDLIRWIAAFV